MPRRSLIYLKLVQAGRRTKVYFVFFRSPICLTYASLSGSRSVESTTWLMGTIAFAKRPNNGRIKNNWRFSIANYQLFCTFACLFGEKPNFANKKIK